MGENEGAPDDEINHLVLAANSTIPNDVVGLNNENLTAGLYETENVPHGIENVQIEERNNCPIVQGSATEIRSHNNGSSNDDDINLEQRNAVNNDLSQTERYLNDDPDDGIDNDIDSVDNDNDNDTENYNDTDNESEGDSDIDSDETDFHVQVEVYFVIIIFW